MDNTTGDKLGVWRDMRLADALVCLFVALYVKYRIGERTETSVTSPSFHYVITGVGR